MLAGVQYGPPWPRSSHGRDMYGQLPPNMQERSRYGQPPPSLQNNETPSPAVPIYLPHPSPPLQVERTPSPTIPIYLPPTSPPPDADFSSRTSSHHAPSTSSSMQVQPSHSERGYTHHPQHCSSATHSTSSSMQVQPSQSMRGPAPTHHVHKPTTHHMPKASTKPDQPPSSRSVHHPKCHMCQTHGVSVIEEGVKWCNPCFEEAKKRRPGTGRAKVSRPACVTCQRNLVEVREGEVTWCKLCFGEAVRKRPGR